MIDPFDPSVQAWLDQERTHVAQTIREFGWFIQYVGGSGPHPTFGYTVGLFGLGHPELVVLGMSMHNTGAVLNDLGDRVRSGANLVPGQLLEFEGWPHRVLVEELPNPGEVVLAANQHYERPPEASVPAYQLAVDDGAGRFPWETGFDGLPRLQPRPGTWCA